MNHKTYQQQGVKKYILYAGILCAATFSMTGCAVVMGDLPATSADLIGCPPQLISIQDEKLGYFNDTWTARCEGRTFYCTRKVRGSAECDEAVMNK